MLRSHRDGQGRRAGGLVRVYAWMMLLGAALALAAAGYVTQSERAYASTAEVVVQPEVSKSGSFLSPAMPTEQRIVTSGSVLGPVANDLGMTVPALLKVVDVTVPVGTNAIDITFTAPSPDRAVAGARAFAARYLTYRNPTRGRPAVVLVSPAERPLKPVAPDYALVVGISLVGGLLVGFGAAYVWDRVRGRLRTVEDVRTSTGLEVLASVPVLPRGGPRTSAWSPRAAPAFDQLVARVPGLVEHRDDFALLVTGATARAGTSTVARETALALVRLGRKVVLVGADDGSQPFPARPVAARTITGHTLRESGVPGLVLAEPGWPAPGAPGGATLDALRLLVQTLTLDSVVVVDGPPAARAGALAFVVDRVLLAVDLRRGLRATAAEAADALAGARDKLVGVVTTMPPRRPGHPARGPLDERVPVGAPVPVAVPARSEQVPVVRPVVAVRRPRPENGKAHLGLVLLLTVLVAVTAWVASGTSRDSAGSAPVQRGAPAATGYFRTSPPGSWRALPGDRACAARVHRTPWEPRPGNARANRTMPDPAAVHAALRERPRGNQHTYDARWNAWLLPRVDGQHTGTTDENIQWAACKWGISDNVLRAIAAAESTWFQYLVEPGTGRCVEKRGCGDVVPRSDPASRVFCDTIDRYGYTYQADYGRGRCPRTFSMMGVMAWQAPAWGAMKANQNGTFPFSRDSTAFALDYIGSFLRGCDEGWMWWLSKTGDYRRGDLWGCVGVWYAGSWDSPAAREYVAGVRDLYDRRIWLDPGWAEEAHSPLS